MIGTDEEALICDLAETYHIFDYRSLPVKLVATLACGLRDSSRIKLSLSNEPASIEIILLARLVDIVTAMAYAGSKEKPPSIIEKLYKIEPKKKENQVVAFNSHDELIEKWEKLTKGR